MTRPTVLVLGDQLTRQVGPLANARPDEVRVLMVESRALLHGAAHHAQKLVLVLAAMRRFADALRRDGFEVAYHQHDDPASDDFASAVHDHLRRHGAGEVTLMTPNDHGVAEPIAAAAERAGGRLRQVANELWITDDALFDRWVEGRRTLRMEGFYREVRRATGILMEDGEPLGGRWNYDADNRARPDTEASPPPPPAFEPDARVREVIKEVEAGFPHRWGEARPFRWPVDREQALRALDVFCRERLRRFGDQQDAMRVGEPFLWHSTLSVPLNLGLLHPREVVDAALAHAEDGRRRIPTNAIEGFVRQVIGWREFVHHVYRTRGAAMHGANALQAHAPLPPAYWGEPTQLHCLGTTVGQLRRTGYAHHIQRLMVLGNVAQLVGVDPEQVLAWFTATHLDALDWVMVPNVLGMSQYADGGTMTSKPYAAGANYLHKMSDACAGCRFDPKAKHGEDACPLTGWYWAFIDRHQERFASNARMRMIVAAWRKRDAAERKRLLERAERDRAAFLAGEL
ncbi:MAG: cryptochrome/photolyase family protein [Trueperaceae bacterium]